MDNIRKCKTYLDYSGQIVCFIENSNTVFARKIKVLLFVLSEEPNEARWTGCTPVPIIYDL